MTHFEILCQLSRKELDARFPVIGRGTARIVYDIGRGRVLKKARKSVRGSVQTETELALYQELEGWREQRRLCPVLFGNDQAVISRKAIPLQTPYTKLPPELVPRFKRMRASLEDAMRIFTNPSIPRDLSQPYHKTVESAWFEDVESLVNSHQLLLGDTLRVDSWGYVNRKFVIIDSGILSEDYHRLYCNHTRVAH